MRISLPVFVRESKEADGRAPVFVCSPLFEPLLATGRAQSLPTAMSRLRRELNKQVAVGGLRQDGVARLLFAPVAHLGRVQLRLDLRNEILSLRFWIVDFLHRGQNFAFTPEIPTFWFQISRDVTVLDEARKHLGSYLRERLRGNDADPLELKAFRAIGDAWILTLEIDLDVKRQRPAEETTFFAEIHGTEKFNRRAELESVGLCLDSLYPDELQIAVNRDSEVEEFQRLLDKPDRRPVVLLGPRLVGKTTLLHEVVRRRVEKRKKHERRRRNVWHLSPARLISGMMFVGQWESRLIAILDEVANRQHILWFDDVLGLYRAGISASSSLSVADVLKPYLQTRKVQVVAEMTPESYHAWLEQDRSLADQFHVFRVSEMTREGTLRVMLHHVQQAEMDRGHTIELNVIPRIMDLQQRYGLDGVMPGKAVRSFDQLAVKGRNLTITADHVTNDFHRVSGLPTWLLDPKSKLKRDDLLATIRAKLIGQVDAANAATDIILTAYTRLNPPGRPLTAMLLLGPTGVGKTHFAKVLTEVLYSDERRMIRLDMNEYSTPDSVVQLVGTFRQPEGLLTSAIRRQPFSLVLLDEIEKAHPDVFDILLQVLGEGRLTDSLGRTSSFENAVIIMTSNLGTQEIAHSIGFVTDEVERQRHFVRAAERFFRPEFVNRLDRIIPFSPLSRPEIRRIANRLLRDMVKREGFSRRSVVLSVSDEALDQVVESGFHPELGARALKRTLEKELIQPVANRLTARTSPQLFRVFAGPDRLIISSDDLLEVDLARIELVGDVSAMLDAVRERTAELRTLIEARRPQHELRVGTFNEDDYHYFACQEQLQEVLDQVGALTERVAGSRHVLDPPAITSQSKSRFGNVRVTETGQHLLLDQQAQRDIYAYINELASSSRAVGDQNQQAAVRLRRELKFLEVLLASEHAPTRVLLSVTELSHTSASEEYHVEDSAELVRNATALSPILPNATARGYAGRYAKLYKDQFGLDVHLLDFEEVAPMTHLVYVSGPHAWVLAALEEGIHVDVGPGGRKTLIHVNALPCDASLSPEAAARQYVSRIKRWKTQLRKGTAEDDPFPLGRIIRVETTNQCVVDLRSRLSTSKWDFARNMRDILLANLETCDVDQLIDRGRTLVARQGQGE